MVGVPGHDKPAAQREVNRGHSWGSHVSANMCKWVTENPDPAATGTSAPSLKFSLQTGQDLNCITKSADRKSVV